MSAVETPMVEHKLDAIFSLTANPAWLTDYVLGDHSSSAPRGPGAVSGWPTITVPFGYVAGLPVGVSFLGPRWSEPRLLALAYAFEQATNPRRAPAFSPQSPAHSSPVSACICIMQTTRPSSPPALARWPAPASPVGPPPAHTRLAP